MPVQILPNLNVDQSQALGTGLSQGLQMLAQNKLGQLGQQMQQQHQARNLALLGLPAEAAYGLAGLPSELQKSALQEYLAWQGAPGLTGMAEGTSPQGIMPSGTSTQQRLPMGSKARQLALKEQSEIEKLERPYYQKTVDQYQSSHDSLKDVNRLINLVQKGKIVNPSEDHLQRWLSKTLKINLKDLRGADTEEFEKINAGFLRNAKNWFGSRVTNYDLQQFLKTIPTLDMSHEGKMRLLGSMKAAAEAQQLRYNTLRGLMKENGGRLPRYAEALVNERVGPQLDKLAEEFISGSNVPTLSEEARKGESRYMWARALKGAGNVAGNVLGALGGTVQSVGNVLGGLGGLPPG